jgi:hypothetical protein
MPRKGDRTIFRNCFCGCGKIVPRTRWGKYPRYISGHGYKAFGRTVKARWRADPLGHPHSKPLGATRLKDHAGILYRMIKTAPRGPWQYEHRVVMTKALGRPIKKDEHVHHINHNTLDNRLKNLAVLSHADHTRLHSKLTQWSKAYLACKRCNTTERKHNGRGLCTACYQQEPDIKARRLAASIPVS